MSDALFRPFETHLDLDRTVSLVREALSGAEDGELFLERRRSESLVLDDGRLKTASYDASEGFGLRAVKGEVVRGVHISPIQPSDTTRVPSVEIPPRRSISPIASRARGDSAIWLPPI